MSNLHAWSAFCTAALTNNWASIWFVVTNKSDLSSQKTSSWQCMSASKTQICLPGTSLFLNLGPLAPALMVGLAQIPLCNHWVKANLSNKWGMKKSRKLTKKISTDLSASRTWESKKLNRLSTSPKSCTCCYPQTARISTAFLFKYRSLKYKFFKILNANSNKPWTISLIITKFKWIQTLSTP